MTCGKDRTIRLFEKTLEPLVLSDEQEEERQKDELATGQDSIVKLPSTKTVSSEKAVSARKSISLIFPSLIVIFKDILCIQIFRPSC